MRGEVLPAVGDADEPGRALRPRHRACESECTRAAFGEEHRDALIGSDPGGVAVTAVAEVRGEEHVHVVLIEPARERHKPRSLEHRVSPRISQDLLLHTKAPLQTGIRHPVGGDTLGEGHDLRPCVALLLGEELAPVGDDESEVARARLIHAREVDLVEDPVAQREPDAAHRRQGGGHGTLRTRSPARRNTGPARGVLDVIRHHGFSRGALGAPHSIKALISSGAGGPSAATNRSLG